MIFENTTKLSSKSTLWGGILSIERVDFYVVSLQRFNGKKVEISWKPMQCKQANPTCGMSFMLQPLFWITCWLSMRCDVSTCALLTSHQIYLSSPPCNGLTHYVENECLICKWRIFAQDTWIPNACSPRRDEINVNSDVSNKKTDRAGGKRNMQVYDDHNEHKITLKTPPGVTKPPTNHHSQC